MFTLPQLTYAYDALEPHVDARTMEIHHTKHHQTYVDKLNAALKDQADLASKTVEELLKEVETLPEAVRQAVRNHGGGHHNHSLFWTVVAPGAGTQPAEQLTAQLTTTFENVDAFKQKFTQAAIDRFGSGWAWLVVTGDKKLAVYSTANQDSPLMQGDTPILGLDVWEHAYYLKYQNKRPDYITAFWNVVNWTEVERRYTEALG